jgi:hypothetical protein
MTYPYRYPFTLADRERFIHPEALMHNVLDAYASLTRMHLQTAVRIMGVNPNGVCDGHTSWAATTTREGLALALEGVTRDDSPPPVRGAIALAFIRANGSRGNEVTPENNSNREALADILDLMAHGS